MQSADCMADLYGLASICGSTDCVEHIYLMLTSHADGSFSLVRMGILHVSTFARVLLCVLTAVYFALVELSQGIHFS